MLNLEYAPAILLALLAGGCTVYLMNRWSRIRDHAKYEQEFIAQHRVFLNQYKLGGRLIPTRNKDILRLTFPYCESEHLLDLCKQAWSGWTLQHYRNQRDLRAYEPSVQIHSLGLLTIPLTYEPIRVEVIQCDDKHALMEAGDGVSGYVLKMFEVGDRALRSDGPELFYIDAKFDYNQHQQQEAKSRKLDQTGRENQQQSQNSEEQLLDGDPALEDASVRRRASRVRRRWA